jgi:hypothetical protein
MAEFETELFHATGFGEEEVDEDLIGMVETQDADIDFTDFSTNEYGTEVSFSVPTPNRTKAEIAREVEDTFISLLKDGSVDELLNLTGERQDMKSAISSEVQSEFSHSYSQALLHNPALKWYSKLANLLESGKFAVKDGQLTLKMPTAMFQKVVTPFTSDFHGDLREESPIVALVLAALEQCGGQDLKAKIEQRSDQDGVSLNDDSMDIAGVDFSEALADISNLDEANVRVDDSGPFDMTAPMKEENLPEISFRDLANKSIAKYLYEKGILESDAIATRLAEERMKQARINQIIGIVRFMKLNASIESKLPKGNRGNGDIDFNFEV